MEGLSVWYVQSIPRDFRYSPIGSIGRRNLPCSTVKAQTVNFIGARSRRSISASSMVSESLPPESATATRSPSRIILKRVTASPTLRRSVFSRSKPLLYAGGTGFCAKHGSWRIRLRVIFLGMQTVVEVVVSTENPLDVAARGEAKRCIL